MIYSQTGCYMGLSFTIAIDLAMDISKQLQASGKVTRGGFGVQAQELNAEVAASFGLKEPNGAQWFVALQFAGCEAVCRVDRR